MEYRSGGPARSKLICLLSEGQNHNPADGAVVGGRRMQLSLRHMTFNIIPYEELSSLSYLPIRSSSRVCSALIF
jgi:hypothetical protein